MVQFFEGHLNISVLKHFFLKKDEKPVREGSKSIGKAIIIENKSNIINCEIEEESPSFIENNGEIIEEYNRYIDRRIRHLYSYVKRVRGKIVFGIYKWINLTKYPWPLNYEKIDYFTEKYSGRPLNKNYKKINAHTIACLIFRLKNIVVKCLN